MVLTKSSFNGSIVKEKFKEEIMTDCKQKLLTAQAKLNELKRQEYEDLNTREAKLFNAFSVIGAFTTGFFARFLLESFIFLGGYGYICVAITPALIFGAKYFFRKFYAGKTIKEIKATEREIKKLNKLIKSNEKQNLATQVLEAESVFMGNFEKRKPVPKIEKSASYSNLSNKETNSREREM